VIQAQRFSGTLTFNGFGHSVLTQGNGSHLLLVPENAPGLDPASTAAMTSELQARGFVANQVVTVTGAVFQVGTVFGLRVQTIA